MVQAALLRLTAGPVSAVRPEARAATTGGQRQGGARSLSLVSNEEPTSDQAAPIVHAPSVVPPLGSRFQPATVAAARSMVEINIAAAQRRARDPLASSDAASARELQSAGERQSLPEQTEVEGAGRSEAALAPLESANGTAAVQGACACEKCESCAAKAVQMAPASGASPAVAMDPESVLRRLGAGLPLPPRLAAHFGRLYGRDLMPVRIHPDSAVAASMGARAITVGAHVAFAPGEYRPDQGETNPLLAHELAHVVQQGGGTGVGVQGAGLGYDGYEAEADQAAATATCGGVVHRLTPVRGSRVQGNIFGDAWDAVGGAAEWAYDNTVGRGIEWLKDKFWAIVRSIAPGLEKYLRNPGLIWDEIVSGAKGVFRDLLDGVLGPFRKGGALAGVGEVLGDLAAQIGPIVRALMAGNCQPLFAALGPVIERFKSFASPVIDAAEKVFSAIKSGIDWVLQKVLAPIWDLLSGVGKRVIDGIRWIIDGIAKAVRWVKSKLSAAWDWVKDLLGLGGDDDAGSGSEDGVWAWVKRKASAAWEQVKSTFMSWLPALKTVGKVLLVLSPFGPLILAFKYGPKLVKWLSDLWKTISNPDNLVKARAYVTNTLLPGAMAFLRSMAAGVNGVAQKVAGALGQISGPLGDLAAKFDATALLEGVAAAVRWLAEKVEAAVSWAVKKLSAAFDAVVAFLNKLWAWLKPILEVLLKVVAVIANPLGLPLFFASWVWLKLPNCFKPPLINFVLDLLIKFVGIWPEAPLLGPLLPMVKHGILGFLKQVRGETDETKIEVSNRIAKLLGGGSLAFMLGFVKGVLVGIWDGIIGPFELVYMLLKFVPQIVGFFESLVTQLPVHAAKVVASARTLVNDAVANFWPAVKSVFSSGGSSGTSIFELLKSVWSAITGAASWVGGKVAGALIGFLRLPDSELGSKLGWVAGAVIFEVALAILTAGGSALLSTLKGPIGMLAKLLVKANQMMEKVFGAILHIIPGLEKGLSKALHFLTENAVMKPIINKLKSLFDNIIELGTTALQKFGREAAEHGAQTAGRKAAQGMEDVASAATRTESRGARAADDVAATTTTKVDSAGQTSARVEADASVTAKAEGAPARAESKPTTETGKALDDRVAKTEKIDSPHLRQADLDAELKYLSENPHLLQGTPPNRTAKIGDHTWKENPGGGWCRHSTPVCTKPIIPIRATPASETLSPANVQDVIDRINRQRTLSAAEEAAIRRQAHNKGGIWNLDPKLRGEVGHALLGEHLPYGFKTIDKASGSGRVATEIRSIKTHQPHVFKDPGSFEAVLKTEIDELANFTSYSLSGTTVSAGKGTTRVLEVGVPPKTLSASSGVLETPQWRAEAAAAVAYAQSRGVKVIFKVVK